MANANSEPSDHTQSPYEKLLAILMPVLFVGNILGGVLMCALLSAGFWEIGRGVLVFYGAVSCPDSPSADACALHFATRGLEFLFLAPLGYSLVLGVARYVEAITPRRQRDADFLALDEARADLLIVKAFSVALFIAVIAASVVGRMIMKDGVEYKVALCGALMIVVLGSYFVLLEKLATHLRREIATTKGIGQSENMNTD